MGKDTSKEFQEYLTNSKGNSPPVSLAEYVESPATAFLRHCVQAHLAMKYCIKNFPKDDHTKAREARLEYISSALLPAIMGHFETYQRYLFSGVFEYSSLLKNLNIESSFKVNIDFIRLAAYRGFGTTSGMILADSLPGWHNSDIVNSYFNKLLKTNLFNEEESQKIQVLWQLRHSIVHTGGSITLPDAQKVDSLRPFADNTIVFENTFISEVSKQFHAMVFRATNKIKSAFFSQLENKPTSDTKERLDKLFLVKSQISAWFPKK